MKVRKRRVAKALEVCLESLSGNLTAEEMVLVISKILIRCGWSIHCSMQEDQEVTDKLKVEALSQEKIEKLYWDDPTSGLTLAKAGYDIQMVLLHRKEKKNE